MKPAVQKILKWGLLALLLTYSTWAAIWAHGEANRHVCTGIDVEVTGHTAMDSIVRNGVLEELHHYPTRIVGTPLRQINTVSLEQYLTGLNNFESVNCMISSGGRLLVKITPLVPVMRVFFGDNSYYINKDGKHIKSNAEFYSDVPVVTGAFRHDFEPKEVLPLVKFIEGDPMMRELTSMIEAQSPDNLLIIPRVRGHVVNFGDTTRLIEKRKALAMFYRQVMPYKGWEEYDTISVKFRGQVVATRRDKSRLNHAEEYYEEVDPEEATLPDAPETGSRGRERADSTAVVAGERQTSNDRG